ncbi:MAG: 30S ribosomal protein S16 [Armatimonadota bacterium]|nr:30S ribosomal protein S16 [Armatimonadota bacterium]
MGTKGRPFYRIVAAPTSAGRDGRFVEHLGHYDPLQEPSLVKVNKERVLHWLKNGASPSDTLVRLLKREGIWEEHEASRPEGKPRRKPVKERVKKEKPVKEKKRKPAPEPAAVAEDAPVEDAPATEDVVEVAEEVALEETPAEETPAEATSTDEVVADETPEEKA